MTDRPTESDGADAIPESPALDTVAGAYDAESAFALDTELQLAEASRALQEVPEIQPGNWDGLAIEERLAALQSVEDALAEIQQRPPLEIHSEAMESGVFGYFDGSRIVVNAGHLEGSVPVEELVDTVVHEGRHAFQSFAVEHPGTITDAAILDAWAANLAPDGYLSAEEYGQELYQTQPVEADAWSYAGRIRRMQDGVR